MNFFVDNRMFGSKMNGSVNMAGSQIQVPPAVAQVLPPAPRRPRFLGQTASTVNDIIDRIKTDVGVLGGYYSRNANLPLEFRVPGSVYATVADYSDAIWKDAVIPRDANPDSQAWNAPAPQSLLSRVALDEQMIADYGNQVSAAEAKYAQSQGSTSTAPTPTPGPTPVAQATVAPQGQGIQLSLGTIVLGAIAVVTIAGVLFFTPANPLEGQVSQLPQR